MKIKKLNFLFTFAILLCCNILSAEIKPTESKESKVADKYDMPGTVTTKEFLLEQAKAAKFDLMQIGSVSLLLPFLHQVANSNITKLTNSISTGKYESDELAKLSVIFAGLRFLTPFAYYFKTLSQEVVHTKISTNISEKLFKHASQQDYKLFLDKSPSDVVSRINCIANSTPGLFASLASSLGTTTSLLTSTMSLWKVNPLFSVANAAMIGTFLHSRLKGQKNLIAVLKKHSKNSNKSYDSMSDSLKNIASMKLFAAENHELKAIQKNSLEQQLSSKTCGTATARSLAKQLALFSAAEMIYLGGALYMHNQGKIIPGDFNALFMNFFFSIMGVFNLAFQIGRIQKDYEQIDSGLKIVYAKQEITDMQDANPLKVSNGKIVFENVNFNYQENQPLFQGTNLVIKPGQKVGLVSYSGGGKTTLVNLILRLFDPASGKIMIDGQDIKNVTQDSLRQNIAMVPQDAQLFNRSLLENIRYGRLSATDEEVFEASKQAGLHEFISGLTEGYNTLIGENGVQLSGGQKQRIAIARAILKKAPILIMDEATSALDSVTEKFIQGSLRAIMADKTAIIIAHRLSTLQEMDRIVVLEKGEIIEDGTPAELLEKGGVYKTLWDAQIGGFLPQQQKPGELNCFRN